MTGSSNAKLIDVARLAGCSPATVSRVLNGNSAVNGDARLRVMQAAHTLAYVPNGSARALRSTKSRLVGAIIPTLDHAIYATMVDGLQARLSEKDVSLIINTSAYDIDVEYRQAKLLVERGAESIILVGSTRRPGTIALLRQKHVAFVNTYTTTAHADGAAIGFNNEAAGRMAGRFLLDLGHKNLGMIAGITLDNDRARGRRDGFLEEIVADAITLASVPVVEAGYTIEAGYSSMRQLMERTHRPTAVFCGSDILAAGALKFCREAGIAVPDQVSVLGFDNLQVADITVPGLTTLEVPARDMGRIAADYVLASPLQRLHMRQTELTIKLVVRGSTKPAPR
jgi:LacI family transcriptional regulator